MRVSRQLVLFTTVLVLCAAAAASASETVEYGAIGKTFRLAFSIQGDRVNLFATGGLYGSSPDC